MRQERGLIIALDMTDAGKALRVAETTSGLCDAFKVNYPLALAAGLEIVDSLSAHGPVLCDFKVADIPATDRLIVGLVFDHSATGIIVHGFPGEDSLRACLEVARGDVYVVTAMSHPGAERFLMPVAEDMALMARKVGATGIIAGATRPGIIAKLRSIVGSLLILSPGVGPQGGDPAEAIRSGADYLIVGRRITEAEDPVNAAERVVHEIEAAKESL